MGFPYGIVSHRHSEAGQSVWRAGGVEGGVDGGGGLTGLGGGLRAFWRQLGRVNRFRSGQLNLLHLLDDHSRSILWTESGGGEWAVLGAASFAYLGGFDAARPPRHCLQRLKNRSSISAATEGHLQTALDVQLTSVRYAGRAKYKQNAPPPWKAYQPYNVATLFGATENNFTNLTKILTLFFFRFLSTPNFKKNNTILSLDLLKTF